MGRAVESVWIYLLAAAGGVFVAARGGGGRFGGRGVVVDGGGVWLRDAVPGELRKRAADLDAGTGADVGCWTPTALADDFSGLVCGRGRVHLLYGRTICSGRCVELPDLGNACRLERRFAAE